MAKRPREAAADGQLAVRPGKPTKSPEIRAIEERVTVVDERHDHLARAVSFGLEAHREHCLALDPPDVTRAGTCDEVSGKLLPKGLLIINASPLAESGNTARVAHLIQEEEPAIADFLKTIPVAPKTSLHDLVLRWIASGAELEKLEHDREELTAKAVAQPVTNATIQAARSQWFRIVSLVLANLEQSDAPAQAIEAIRGPVVRASDRAGKRYATGKTEEPVLDPEDDADGEPSPDDDAEDASPESGDGG